MLLHFFTSNCIAAALLALTATSTSAPANDDGFPQHTNLHRPTYVDAEWVVQARDVGFSGFFFEFLGLSSSIRKHLPFMKYSKSNFHTSSDEPLNFRDPDYLFSNLFDKEKSDLQYISSSYLDKSSSYYDASLPNFMFIKPIAGVQTRTSISVVSNFCANASVYQTSTGAGFKVENFPLGRGRIDMSISGSSSSSSSSSSSFSTLAHHVDCCEWCSQLTPICSAFSYSQSLKLCNLYGSYKKPELSLPQVEVGSSNPPDVLVGDLVANKFARMYSPPKVVIFHGQTCIFRNDTVLGNKRDVSVINIGRFMVERAGLKGGMNLFDFSMLACASVMDEIWVPTDEHKRLFEELGRMSGHIIPSVYVIPEAVDTTLFDPSLVKDSSNNYKNNDNGRNDNDSQVGRRYSKVSCSSKLSFNSFYEVNKCLKGDGYNDVVVVDEQGQLSSDNNQNNTDNVFEFLSVFKWESRKGWDSLLTGYWAAFTKDDPVVLKIITFIPKDSPEYVSKGQTDISAMMNSLAKSKFGHDSFESLAKVVIIDVKEIAPLSRADFREIYSRADAFVLATRGEGWGLPIAEAMAMELPVIVTNCLGPSHYANENNAYLIPIVPGEIDNLGYITPDSAALTSIFRQVVIDSTSTTGPAAVRGANARKTMQDFSPDFVVNAIIGRFKSLYNLRGWSI